MVWGLWFNWNNIWCTLLPPQLHSPLTTGITCIFSLHAEFCHFLLQPGLVVPTSRLEHCASVLASGIPTSVHSELSSSFTRLWFTTAFNSTPKAVKTNTKKRERLIFHTTRTHVVQRHEASRAVQEQSMESRPDGAFSRQQDDCVRSVSVTHSVAAAAEGSAVADLCTWSAYYHPMYFSLGAILGACLWGKRRRLATCRSAKDTPLILHLFQATDIINNTDAWQGNGRRSKQTLDSECLVIFG